MPRSDPFPALWRHDQELLARLRVHAPGLTLCGVDEAGRGPLAGPVVAGAVILPDEAWLPGLDDSKRLKEAERVRLEEEIRGQALACATGSASVEEIDQLGILRATFLAMRRAVDPLPVEPGYVLVDGRDFPFAGRAGRSLVKGDSTSACVAAAAILAKQERDRLLLGLDALHPGWGFARHKGYGTAAHLALLFERGRLPVHRKSFRLPWEKEQPGLPLA